MDQHLSLMPSLQPHATVKNGDAVRELKRGDQSVWAAMPVSTPLFYALLVTRTPPIGAVPLAHSL